MRLMTSPCFAHLSPKQLVPQLADEGLYLASESTFYRLQRRHGLRRRLRTISRTDVARAGFEVHRKVLSAFDLWELTTRDTPSNTPLRHVLLIEGDRPSREPATRERGAWRRMLVHRDVLLLAASYFCMNYIFYMLAQWLFTYLVKARGFSRDYLRETFLE